MFTWLCVSPMHFFFHFENLQYNYHAQTRVWDWGSGPPQFHSLPPPPLKKRNPLNLDLPWSGGGPPPPRPYLGKFSGSRHHYTTSFIKVRAEIYPCKSPGERISFWHHDSWLDSRLLGTFRIQVHALLRQLYLITQLHVYLITHLIPDKHKKLFADLKKIHDDILNIRILI